MKPPAAADVAPTRPSNLVVVLLSLAIAALVAVGIFGLTRPPSDEAKRQGDMLGQQSDKLAQQVDGEKKGAEAAQSSVTTMRSTVSKLEALDSQEADAANSTFRSLSAAVDAWNAGNKGAFSDPAISNAVGALRNIVNQEKTLLSEFQQQIAQAQGAK